MALTFGQMTTQILAETYRDASFSTQVQNAIVSAIKELEIEQLFINTELVYITVPAYVDHVPLPTDFISVLQLSLLIGPVPPLPTPPVFPQDYNSFTIVTASSGFEERSFYDLKNFRRFGSDQGIPGVWAIFGDKLYLHPWTNTGNYILEMYYYYRDAYPVNENDTSIWMGDFTQDVTRYKARGIFYRDSLQSPELAASEFEKAGVALSQLRLRNSQRSTINNLSM